MKAHRIDELTPTSVDKVGGRYWLAVDINADAPASAYKNLPNIVEYNKARFYKMSYNSDHNKAYYKEAKNLPYHLRYCNYS